MRLFAVFFAVALLFSMQQPRQITAATNGEETRLLAAMKLWGDVKFFDPQVAGGTIDWDAAFMSAEPAIVSAKTATEYRAAIGGLIAPLHDPATHLSDEIQSPEAHITVGRIGAGTVITLPHGVVAAGATFAADASHAIEVASTAGDVVVDIRGLTEADDGDAYALRYLSSPESLLMHFVSGPVSVPRSRSRAYLGYPSQSGGYQGYFASDSTPDAPVLAGQASDSHRLAFLVDGTTTLPLVAVALAEGGTAAIYTTAGNPSTLSGGAAHIELTDGVRVAFRTGDLADIDSRQALFAARVSNAREALDALRGSTPSPAHYARAAQAMTNDDAYADKAFPPEPMRMLAIARIYNVIRYFSPYRALMHDDWDGAAVQAIRDERAAADARSYLLGIMRFYAHLHDSHGFVSGSLVSTEFGAGVPFITRYLHGQVVVTALSRDSAANRGVRIGDVVDTVNGLSVRQAMNWSEQFICSSTQQAADSAALEHAMRPSIFWRTKGLDANADVPSPTNAGRDNDSIVHARFLPTQRAAIRAEVRDTSRQRRLHRL